MIYYTFGQQLAVEVVTLVVILLSFSVRLFVFLHQSKHNQNRRHERISMAFLIISFLFVIAMFVLVTSDMVQMRGQRTKPKFSLTKWYTISHILQMQFHVTAFWALRASYLATLWKGYLGMSRRLQHSLTAVSIFLGATWVGVTLWEVFYCGVPGTEAWWNSGCCPGNLPAYSFYFAMSVVCDISILSIGIYIVYSSSSSPHIIRSRLERWAIALLFFIAFLSTAATTVQYVLNYKIAGPTEDGNYVYTQTVLSDFVFERWIELLFPYIAYGLTTFRRLVRYFGGREENLGREGGRRLEEGGERHICGCGAEIRY